MASDLASKCRAAGETVQEDLDVKESPADGVSFFEAEAYPEVQDVKKEFEKANPKCTWQRGVYWRKNFADSTPSHDINFLVLKSATKEPGAILYSRDGQFPRGVYLCFLGSIDT